MNKRFVITHNWVLASLHVHLTPLFRRNGCRHSLYVLSHHHSLTHWCSWPNVVTRVRQSAVHHDDWFDDACFTIQICVLRVRHQWVNCEVKKHAELGNGLFDRDGHIGIRIPTAGGDFNNSGTGTTFLSTTIHCLLYVFDIVNQIDCWRSRIFCTKGVCITITNWERKKKYMWQSCNTKY
jgi:hypothetical protein